MRVTWVHPSWRDLVIEHLATDVSARQRFLHGCSIHGALLALSVAGGQAGGRRLPLLRSDADRDALTDRAYELVPELEPAELVGLLDGTAQTIVGLGGSTAEPEADALARALLARVSQLWHTARTPVPLPALEAWLGLAGLLKPKAPPPPIAITWAELLPADTPDFSDGASIERFTDWLTLAELLLDYGPELLDHVGFPGRSLRCIEGFLNTLERAIPRLGTLDTDQARRALTCIPRLIPPLSARANAYLYRLESRAQPQPPEDLQSFRSSAAHPGVPESGRLDVERVLRDL